LKTLTLHAMNQVALFAALLWVGSMGPGCSSQRVGATGDGSPDAESDAEVDGAVDAWVECGDPDVLARYPACAAADDEASCLAAGGQWGVIGLAPYPECQCPTGQSTCPCTHPADCRSACFAELTGNGDCEGTTSGLCSAVSITVGCFCLFFDDGHVEDLCVD
jgi:hypothetical protein